MAIKILDRYLIREFFNPFLVSISGFVIFMLGSVLFQLNEWFIEKGVDLNTIIRLLILKLPYILVLGFPVGTLFATLLTLGGLSQNSEIVPMRVGGMSPPRIIAPFLFISFLICSGAYLNNEYIVPKANRLAQDIMIDVVYDRTLPDIQEDIFFKADERRYFYIGRIDNRTGTMKNITVYELKYGGTPQLVIAEEGKWGKNEWKLREATVYQYDKDGYTISESHNQEYNLHMEVDRRSMAYLKEQKSPSEMNRSELRGEIEKLRKDGSNTQPLEVDYQMKVSTPFASFVFALIGAPLGFRRVKAGKAFGIIASIVLSFTYLQIMSLSRSWGRIEVLPVLVGAWSHALIYALIGIVMILVVSRR